MRSSRPTLPADRHAIGQLLVRLLTHFRLELFNHPLAAERFPDVRFAHLQIWGNLGVDGIRLTDLADRATLSLAACSELVNELQAVGYLERKADPTDGRAKLIFPTPRGKELLDTAGEAVAELEDQWRDLVPEGAFDDACRTLDDLLAQLDDLRGR
jgi:DNA-binding MarR family transcriptional regulator